MSKGLIIVESPAKARTIQKFVSNKYVVKASLGHIRDLPKSTMGVDIENNFEPRYLVIRGKASIIKELKESAAKHKNVYLAPDPDREGEAIAWHLSEVLNKNDVSRIELHEITKPALEKALSNPSKIDMDRVKAQQTRRILDRLLGYELSPLLWKKISGGLSAGRVQSVAVRLIVEREKEIQDFQPEEYWSIDAVLSKHEGDFPFEASLVQKDSEKIKISNEDEASKILEELKKSYFKVKDVTRKEQRKNPSPPFITSSLQQEASRKLGFRVYRTMMIAQQLYEGLDIGSEGTVGLITYMRTDSPRISDIARAETLKFIKQKFGEAFEGPIRQYKAKPGAQEAHEAVRPTSIYRDPESIKGYLSRDQFRLYKLIWERFLASQMASCIMDVEIADISADGYLLRAQGTTVKFPGYTAVYVESKEDNGENGEEKKLPPLVPDELLNLLELKDKQHFTQPPPRYTEASLIKTLEEKGIGRPSTYAPIVETIQKRGYAELLEKRFHPTKIGGIVTDLLIKNFPTIVNVDFTAEVEGELDKIEEGTMEWVKVLNDFYKPFKESLVTAQDAISKIVIEPELSDEVCPTCGKQMAIKRGRFGTFLACTGYPECKTNRLNNRGIGLKCPEEGCTGKVVQRRSRKGVFYGCSRYPDCKFVSWYRPTDKRCTRCGKVMVLRSTKNGKTFMHCIDKDCKAVNSEVNNPESP
ncbi:MAG: type I DNA topoisomerase [Firmicutes bacterium]|nr:type I DNA topoisomerase [Bacillota bacterium]